MSSPETQSSRDVEIKPAFSSVDVLRDRLKTDLDNGLRPAAVENAQREYGPNKLEGEGTVKWYSVLFKQIINAMILVSRSKHKWTQRPDQC